MCQAMPAGSERARQGTGVWGPRGLPRPLPCSTLGMVFQDALLFSDTWVCRGGVCCIQSHSRRDMCDARRGWGHRKMPLKLSRLRHSWEPAFSSSGGPSGWGRCPGEARGQGQGLPPRPPGASKVRGCSAAGEGCHCGQGFTPRGPGKCGALWKPPHGTLTRERRCQGRWRSDSSKVMQAHG